MECHQKMSRKILLVGPPGVGKTTLRKIFFEGENTTRLLEYALDPTFGEESLILRLKDDIGIFDLAGQENKRWFETEDRIIFEKTEVIIVVLEANYPSIEDTLEFIKKIIDIRNELTSNSKIFLLIHKIDLVDKLKLDRTQLEIKNIIRNVNHISLYFTSIKKQFLNQTYSVFVEILKVCIGEEISTEKVDFNLLKKAVEVLYHVEQELAISFKDLQKIFVITEEKLNEILKFLQKLDFIAITGDNNERIIKLTNKGKTYYKQIINEFSLSSMIKPNKETISPLEPQELIIPPFVGYFIANKDGVNLISTDIKEGALESYLSDDNIFYEKRPDFDIQLIPMFISALEKFSREVNIKDMSGFSLKGSNLKMQIFSFEDYTVTLFTNPNINLKSIEYRIIDFFLNLFEKFKVQFDYFEEHHSLENFDEIVKYGRDWLKELNNSYEHMVSSLVLYDIEQANKLYKDLDDMYGEVKLKMGTILEKIKELKINLIKATVHENYDELKDLAKRSRDLQLNYLT